MLRKTICTALVMSALAAPAVAEEAIPLNTVTGGSGEAKVEGGLLAGGLGAGGLALTIAIAVAALAAASDGTTSTP